MPIGLLVPKIEFFFKIKLHCHDRLQFRLTFQSGKVKREKKMKIFLILALVTMAFGDDGGGIAPPDIEHPSLDYALRQSQQELTWGHEFAEEWLVQNREMLSELLIRIELRVIEDFMDAFTEIQNIAEDTRRRMEEDYPEPSFCKNRIRDRWDLQVVRFGTKMSQCLGIADG